MIRQRIAVAACAAILVLPDVVRAQDIERPAAFDTAGRLLTLSPPLVQRLGLGAPLWPGTGDFVEARLFQRLDGTYVLAVEQRDGSIWRFPLDAAMRARLAEAVAMGMVTTGLLSTTERADFVSEPAGNRFVMSQLAAGLILYGPAAALYGEGSAAGALYLLTAGGTFFIASAVANRQAVTRAQATLATDGLWRGALMAQGLRRAFGHEDQSGKEVMSLLAAGGLTGTIAGLQFGRTLTDAEASGAVLGSTVAAGLMLGTIGIAGGLEGGPDGAELGLLVGSGLAGYPAGLHWIRHARYRITPGDVSAVTTAGMVGALLLSAAAPEGSENRQVASVLVTAGFVGGLSAGANLLAKRYDLTDGQGSMIRVGALAGGLMGAAIPLVFEAEGSRAGTLFGALGAMAGMAAARAMTSWSPARSSR